MKRLIFILLLTSSYSFAQTLCDDVTYSILNQTDTLGNPLLVLEGDVSAIGVTIDYISWDWMVCDVVACFTSDDQIATFSGLVDSCSVKLSVYIIANGDTCILDIEDILIFGNNGWELQGGVSSVVDVSSQTLLDNSIFDVLGREYAREALVPVGIIYIKNNKKYIKIR